MPAVRAQRNVPAGSSDCRAVDIRVGNSVVSIDIATMESAVAAVTERTVLPWSYVVTPNVYHLRLIRQGRIPASLYAGAAFRFADGWPVALLAGRAAGKGVPRVAGSDLLESILATDGSGRPLVFVGGSDGPEIDRLLQRAESANWLPSREPAPPREVADPSARTALIERFTSAGRGGIVVLGLGAPKQEFLAREAAQSRPGMGVILCLGMSINFSAGITRRAPAFIRAARLEWLHRGLTEPRRLGPRYLADAMCLARLFLQNR